MPRNVRNFWVEGTNDAGRKITFGASPKADGSFGLVFYQRADGEVTKVLNVEGRAMSDGRLVLLIDGEPGAPVVADGKWEGDTWTGTALKIITKR